MDILNRLISYSFFFYIFHHDISNLRSLWRLHRVRENETRLYKKKPTENPKTKILDFEEGCLRRDIPYYHTILQIFKKKIMIYCKYGSRDFQNTFSNFSSVNQKGMILYWNKLERFPSMGAL